MTKSTIKTHSPQTKTWTGITITKNAVKQILYLISLDIKNEGIRLIVKRSGCAGFRYSMKLINNENIMQQDNKNNMIFYYQKILICISLKEVMFFNGIKIDFIKNSVNKVFKFYNSKIDAFCGCGESFTIK